MVFLDQQNNEYMDTFKKNKLKDGIEEIIALFKYKYFK